MSDRILLLPLRLIHVDPKLNVSRGGRAITASNVASLAEDISANGQQEPVGVVRLEDAGWIQDPAKAHLEDGGVEYVLVYGFRRLAAVAALSANGPSGVGRVRAVCHDGPMSLAKAELFNVAENWSRDPPNEFDLTIACDRFIRVHKLTSVDVSKRINKPVAFVDACVKIASKVAPDLIDHYKVNCSKENRRRMVLLSEIEASTERERHQLQREKWKELEGEAADFRRKDPQGGMRPNRKKAGASPVASRSDLRAASERVVFGTEVFDGQRWVPMDSATKAVLMEWIRWSMNANSDFPVR